MHVIERTRVSDVVANATAVSSPVKRSGQALKSFLPCSIPNLKNDSLVLELDLLVGEISAYGGLELI